MSFRFGGIDRRGFMDDYRDRRWSGGGDRYDDRGRYGGSGKGRDRPGGKSDRRGQRGGKDRKDRRPSAGDRGQGVKRRSENKGDSNAKKLKPGNNWHGEDRHSLMHALTMESKPENLEDDWVFVVRPPGRRRTVVAANNVTQSYNNAHTPDMKFETCLPSGNVTKDAMFKQQDLTILDTVYSPEKKTFYVVDMVHWRHYPYYDTEDEVTYYTVTHVKVRDENYTNGPVQLSCVRSYVVEADFRFFCLEDKWLQLERPGEIWQLNDYPFQLLHKYPCTDEKIEEVLKDFNEKVDDILFIKKNSLYSPSDSPDCLKLRLDKLHDVLGIAVPEGVEFSSSSSSKSKDEGKKEQKESKEEKVASEEKIKREVVESKDDIKSENSPPSEDAEGEDDMDDDGEQEPEDKE